MTEIISAPGLLPPPLPSRATTMMMTMTTEVVAIAGARTRRRSSSSSSVAAFLRRNDSSLLPSQLKLRPFHSGLPLPLPLLPSSSSSHRWTLSTWLDTSAQVEVNVPLAEAWDLWTDRERLNRWMPWIHSIKVSKEKPEYSDWTLKYAAFGQNLEFKWTARNLQPIHHQKIHWRSVDGLPNRGAVRFYPRGPSSVGIQLTTSYEVPDILAGVASALSPLVESILRQDLERFAAFAEKNRLKAPSQ